MPSLRSPSTPYEVSPQTGQAARETISEGESIMEDWLDAVRSLRGFRLVDPVVAEARRLFGMGGEPVPQLRFVNDLVLPAAFGKHDVAYLTGLPGRNQPRRRRVVDHGAIILIVAAPGEKPYVLHRADDVPFRGMGRDEGRGLLQA